MRYLVKLLMLVIYLSLTAITSYATIIPTTLSNNKTTLVVDMIGYNPTKGELTSRITARLPPSLIESNAMVADDYYLIEKYTVGNSLLKIRKNTPFEAYNNTITLTHMVTHAGVQWLYPFDEHNAKLKVIFAKATTTSELGMQALPTTIDCQECFFDGFDLNIQTMQNPDNSQEFFIHITRSLPRKAFIIFINLMMLSVAIFILIMAIRLVRHPKRPDIGNLGFIGGLLFALPAVRNLQPNVPPVGILIDYLGFFEAEILIASSLILVIIAWLLKPNQDG